MLQNINNLSNRTYKATIGIGKENFKELAAIFAEIENKEKEKHYKEYEEFYDRKPSSGGSPIFETSKERLFCVLFYLKTYPTFDLMGFTFGCSGKTAHENVYKNLSTLEKTLNYLDVLPKRKFKSTEEFIEFIKSEDDIIIDATERLHHRKKDNEEQKKYYNGKQKDHTVKNTIISNPDQKVLFVGETFLGSVHDFKIIKIEFPPNNQWFIHVRVWIDLGYIGFGKNYEVKEIKIPFKKPYKTKKNPNPKLTPAQKEYNKEVSKTRVKVENAIGGIKRYNILVDRIRNKNKELRDKSIFIAAGLWNFFKGYSFS